MTALFSFPAQAELGRMLCEASALEEGKWTWRTFPDGESYVRIESDVRDKEAIILCSLNHPDEKTLALIFLAHTLKELGCTKITLIAPYLGYMRQDKRFHEGEAVTSDLFAKLLSGSIDALITIDPHLHRHVSLEEIYACPCKVLTATGLMTQWIKNNVMKPLIVGPDAESEQWVAEVAAETQAPYVILNKTRHGDRDVEITLPDLTPHQGRVPVLVDDIVSTATTMIKTVSLLREHGFAKAVCLATHGLFADDAYHQLKSAGDIRIVTTNAIPHPSNRINVAALLAEGLI